MDSATSPRHDGCLPNLLVFIDLRDGEPTPPTLFALSEARRVAHHAGATVFAVALGDRELPEAIVERLGRAGADKVLLCEGRHLGAPPLDVTHGAALLAAIERVPPLLVLFPAGGVGAELGPGLAARIGAAFGGIADLEVSPAPELRDGVGRVVLRRLRSDRTGYRRLDPVDIERPVVAVLVAGRTGPERGSGAIDVEVIACPSIATPLVDELASEPDEHAAIALASALVIVDAAAGVAAAARLRSAAPGMAVALAGDGAALAPATPELLIDLGGTAPPVAVTPRSRVGVVTWNQGADATRTFMDVLWTAEDRDAALDELVAALAALAAADDKDSPA